MNQLIIRKQNIDFDKIINMTLSKKDWGKSYTLYNLGDVSIQIIMTSYNFERREATFKLKIEYSCNDEVITKEKSIWYYQNQQNIQKFKRKLEKECLSFLESTIQDQLKNEADKLYWNKHYYSWNIRDQEIIKAGFQAELEEIKALSSNISDSCYEVLQNKVLDIVNQEYHDLVMNYKYKNKVKNDYIYKLLEDIKNSIEKSK